MNAGKKEIQIYQTNLFRKEFNKLSESEKDIVDEQISLIEDDPHLGEQKKGDLSHVLVHKFSMNNQQVLLGYSWVDKELELYLLNIASHENFYTKLKKRRKADLRTIKG